MWCHPFYISYVCNSSKVWQDWNTNNTLGSCTSKQTEHPSCVSVFSWTWKTTIIRVVYDLTLRTFDHRRVAVIPYFLWVHGQSLTKRWYTQYSGIVSTTTTHLSYRQELAETANHHAILRVVYTVVWRTEGHICVTTHSIYLVGYGGDLTSLWYTQYTGKPYI